MRYIKQMIQKTFFLVLILALSSCASSGGLVGALYTGVSTPVNATAQPKGDKMGESCAMSILGLIAIGDASIETARKNGRISKITSVDTTFSHILGILYASNCTIVRGK